MLFTIRTTHQPATDLGYLLHKHPDKVHDFDLGKGKAWVFYPEATETSCTAALLLDIDPVALVRGSGQGGNEAFTLDQYVNDRPYSANSLMSVAIASVFSTALNGRCRDKPELAALSIPLEMHLPAVPVSKGGGDLLRWLFEPLGYELQAENIPLDVEFPEWGNSRFYSVTLRHTLPLAEALAHLYVLIPVLDNSKHYFVSKNEVEKLLEKGKSWLKQHPEKDFITRRYLRHHGELLRAAFDRLKDVEEVPQEETESREAADPEKEKLHALRLKTVAEMIRQSGAKRVLDLGCGEGKLLRMLAKEKQFTSILGMDVTWRSLEIAKKKLRLEEQNPPDRIALIQGALTYRDQRLAGYDAAAVIEVIEHLEPERLSAFERVLFEFARPRSIFLTTPNAEYNSLYETLPAGHFRHDDHRFEWTRAEFEAWARRVAEKHNYSVEFFPLGEMHETLGGPSQMGVFTYGN